MSGLLALLDDVAAIAKLAATQIDDAASQAAKVGAKVATAAIDDAAKAGAKAAGVVIDDAAVTPKYVTGLPAARELPIVWKIARASFFNKLVILLPAALLLNAFVPWILTPLLMLGGTYLCFEGAEKVAHLFHKHEASKTQKAETLDAAHLEEERVRGAIKTDFILSAEIMTISLAAIETQNVWLAGVSLAFVAVGITALVYGAVALIVKADDVGIALSTNGRTSAGRALGRGIVKGMPWVLTFISVVGTAAMLWVGGSIMIHGLYDLGWSWPKDVIHDIAVAASGGVGFIEWLVTATIDGVLGLVYGLAVIPVVNKIILPITRAITGKTAEAGGH